MAAAMEERRKDVGHAMFASREAMPQVSVTTVRDDERVGRLHVRVVKAQRLAAKDSNGTSDPYCEVFLGDRSWRSSVKTMQLSPTWEEGVKIDVKPFDELLHLILFDWNRVTDGLKRIRSSSARPKNAAVAVRYRDSWFFIEDSDLDSKSTFSMLAQLYSLQAGGSAGLTPVLTLPVGD